MHNEPISRHVPKLLRRWLVLLYHFYHQIKAGKMTVREYLHFLLESRGVPQEKANAIVADVLGDIAETQSVYYQDNPWRDRSFIITEMLLSELVLQIHRRISKDQDMHLFLISRKFFPTYIYDIIRGPGCWMIGAEMPATQNSV
jgi:hypothetical protein